MPTSWRSRLPIGLAVLAVAVGLFFVMRSLSGDSAEVAPTPEPSESATPSEEPVAQPKPFRVKILSAKGTPVDGRNMFGRKPGKPPAAVRQAAGAAGKTLERYLNAAFVNRKTRFTPRPLEILLTDNAARSLDARDRRALGSDGPTIKGGTTMLARARAVVLYKGDRAHAVTLTYTAKMRIVQTDKPELLTQSGTLVLRRSGNGTWRADLADVELSLPARPAEKPAGESSETSSEDTEEPTEGVTP